MAALSLDVSSGAERWAVRSGDGPGAVAAWEDVLAGTHVGFDVRLPAEVEGRFSGEVARRRMGSLCLVDCACTPFSGRRGRAVMGPGTGEDWIGLQIVRRGVERVSRGRGRYGLLESGGIGVWDGSRAVGVDVVEPLVKRTVIFPRELVEAVSPRLVDVEALRGLGDRPGGRLLVRYVNALALELPELEERTAAAAADVVLELFRAAVEPELPETRSARREALRVRVRRYVRVNLQDPRLGPESIARALSVSVRTLHAAFADTDESVAGLVRRARLARCAEDLAEPGAGSVTEIAFRWGFTDATHFSHAFKREFGCTPREVRAGARIGK